MFVISPRSFMGKYLEFTLDVEFDCELSLNHYASEPRKKGNDFFQRVVVSLTIEMDHRE